MPTLGWNGPRELQPKYVPRELLLGNLGRALSRLIPVQSFTKERAAKVAPIPKPEVGLRWGKPVTFELPKQKVMRYNFTVEDMHDVRRYIGKEVRRDFEDHEVESPEPLPVEGIQSATFYCGQRAEYTERVAGPFAIQDKTIVHQYVELTLPLTKEVGRGARGDPPAKPTPEPYSPEAPGYE